MALTSVVIPGKQFSTGETVTYPKLNLLGQPNITITGALSDLSNVATTTPANGQPLVWNNGTSKWTPGTVASAYQEQPSNLVQYLVFNQQFT